MRRFRSLVTQLQLSTDWLFLPTSGKSYTCICTWCVGVITRIYHRWSEALHGMANSPGIHFGGDVRHVIASVHVHVSRLGAKYLLFSAL